MKKVLITLSIGVIAVSAYFFFEKDKNFGVINPIMTFEGKSVELVYTDENVGENLIIHSDTDKYFGLYGTLVYFSVENTSGKNQNIKIAFSKDGGNLAYVKRIVNVGTVIDEKIATSSIENVISQQEILIDKQLRNFISDYPLRKSVKGLPTDLESGYYFVKAGDTAFFEAKLLYSKEGEFFIEAFGDQSGYGSLDPSVSFISAGTIVSDLTSTCSITPSPPTHTTGDIIVVSAWNTGGGAMSTATAGWAEINEVDGTGNAAWYWKRATGAGTAGPNITASNTDCFAVAYIFRGVNNTATPYEDNTTSGDGTTADGTPDTALITTAGNLRMAVSLLAHDDDTLWTPNPHSPPTGWTSSSDLVSADGTDAGFTVITQQIANKNTDVPSAVIGTFTGGATELYGALTLAFWPNHTYTANGNAQIDTAQSQFGGASGLFDGTTDYVTAPDSTDFDLGAAGGGADFTLSLWVRFNVDPGATEMGLMATYSVTNGIQVYIRNVADVSSVTVCSNPTACDNISWNPTTNTWYHFAIVRNSTTITQYIDGTSIGTYVDRSWNDDNAGISIGSFNLAGGGSLNGWIDDFSIQKGTARWTANFTPPTSADCELTNGITLLHMDGADASTTFTDDNATACPSTATARHAQDALFIYSDE